MRPLLLIAICFLSFSLWGQTNRIQLGRPSRNSGLKISSTPGQSIRLSYSLDKLNWSYTTSNQGEQFAEIWIDKGYSTGEIGAPKLPAFKQLIRIPDGTTPKIRVISYREEIVSLEKEGVLSHVVPVQPSVSKGEDSTKIRFQIRRDVYAKNSYQQPQIARLEVLGTLRSYTVARLVVSPVDYNPVAKTLRVFNDIELDVSFPNAEDKHETDLQAATYSPYFDVISQSLLNATSSTFDEHPDLTRYPVKMLIISDRMFESELKPYIAWKTLKGFRVVTAYTDVIGSNPDLIKTYIREQYNSATGTDPAPTFLVLVGDVAQVPASATGSSSGKKTDLYYASTDGDMFPEMYYGRLSAATPAQLKNIVDKILYYERYQFEDPTYLNNVTLIAGVDATWNPKVAQPTVKYGTANYFNPAHGFGSIYEFGVSNDPSNPAAIPGYTNCYAANKIAVGLINYTAHCSQTSWNDPSLSIASVNGFTNTNRYPVALANCCYSGDFGFGECIGEAWLRAEGKGAVTYIGSAPSSYWLEDMYWSVGAFPMVGENNGYVPTLAETTLGAYDEPFASSYFTTGPMVFAGNLAVTEVDIQGYPNQSSPTYYWQAYNILGDPSIMPYLTEAEANDVSHSPTIPIGVDMFRVFAKSGSYVALTKDTVILGTAFVDQTGEVEMPITPVVSSGDVVIVVTRPQTIPYIDTIAPVALDGPYLTLKEQSVSDPDGNNNGKADFGELVSVNLVIQNIGIATASNVRVSLTEKAGYTSLASNATIQAGSIPVGESNNSVTIHDAFRFRIADNVPDQTVDRYKVMFESDEGSWTSTLKFTINAPVLSIDELIPTDSITGNSNGTIGIGELCSSSFSIINSGNAPIDGLTCRIVVPDTLHDVFSVSYQPIDTLSIGAKSSKRVGFRFASNPNTLGKKTIPLVIDLQSPRPASQSQSMVKYITLLPDCTILQTTDTIFTCFASFYDSGGPDKNYSNNENLTSTLVAANEYSKLHVRFEYFASESKYDFLYIYDGPDKTYPQVSGSPFNGTTLPPEIYSTGRALTFRFVSDKTNTARGWSATVECFYPSSIPSCVSNPLPADDAKNVLVEKLQWDPTPNAQFYEVFIGNSPTSLGYLGRVPEPNARLSLDRNKTYYWKVIPGNGTGPTEDACETWCFTTDSVRSQVLMANATLAVDTAWFFDSGGAAANYSNNSDYTLTLKPRHPGSTLRVEFLNFTLESSTSCKYDRLELYDGSVSDETKIGTYCGTTIPPAITATNAEGILSFVFHSDGSETKSGWKALVKSIGIISPTILTFNVNHSNQPVTNAIIRVDDYVKTTNPQGQASFALAPGNLSYTVVAQGYAPIQGTCPFRGVDTTITVSLQSLYESTFRVLSSADGAPLPGAKIRFASDSSFTNSSGEAKVKLPNGNYQYAVSAFGHDPRILNLTVNGQGVSQAITLNPSCYKTTFRVVDRSMKALEGAILVINSDTLLTDTGGCVSDSLYYGTYGYTVSREGYLPISQWVRVVGGINPTIVLDSLVNLNHVALTVTGKGPRGASPIAGASATFYYNSMVYAKSETDAEGHTSTRLPKGSYAYTVSKEGYYPGICKPFAVWQPSNTLLDTLEQITYSVDFLVISDNNPVPGATVILNGYPSGSTDGQGLVSFSRIGFERNLGYVVSRSGYLDHRGEIDVVAPCTVTVSLTPNSVSIDPSCKMLLYPNPADDVLTLNSDNQFNRIEIRSITGIKVYLWDGPPRNSATIPIRRLTPGVYVVNVKFQSQQVDAGVVKFIKR